MLGGAHSVALKRFLDRAGLARSAERCIRAPPPVLIVHDGPGLPSRYLEPLSARLQRPQGRACYLYDQLGCGLSEVNSQPECGFGLQQSVEELTSVLRHMREQLAEEDVHLAAHGFGGVVVMEALLHGRLSNSELPRLRSISLLGVPSCTEVADEEAQRLMAEATAAVGLEDAASSFWYRHVCALRPQPSCLSDAYSKRAAEGPASEWKGFGALRGFRRTEEVWQLQGQGLLQSWRLHRSDVSAFYRDVKSPPLLSLRGEHDFVTERCTEAWRGASDGPQARPGRLVFRERVIGGCGHNAHLENPEAVAALIRLWLLDVEEKPSDAARDAVESRQTFSVQKSSFAECQFLARAEARRQLDFWASELSWASTAGTRASWSRSVHAAALPQRDVRRLAEWAWNLPQLPPRSVASLTAEELREALATWPRLALGLLSSAAALQAIVCLEADFENPKGSLRIVGAATVPGAPSELCEDALRQVRVMIAQAFGEDRAGL